MYFIPFYIFYMITQMVWHLAQLTFFIVLTILAYSAKGLGMFGHWLLDVRDVYNAKKARGE